MSDGARVIFLSVLAIAALASFNLENVAWPAEASKSDAAMKDRVRALIPDIDAYIVSGMKGFDVPGLAIGIVAGDKLVYAKGFGVRSKSTGLPVDTRTVFQIGSTTKAFLAATEAIMVDRGKLRWDDRVVDLDPDFQLKDPWVTREFRCLRSASSALQPSSLCQRYARHVQLRRRGTDPFAAQRRAGVEFPHDLRLHQHHASSGRPHRGQSRERSGLECCPSEGTARSPGHEGFDLHGRSHPSGARPCQRLPLDTGRLDRGAFHTDFSLSPGRGGRHQHQRRGYGALDSVAAWQRRLRGTPHCLAGKPRLYAQTNGGGKRSGVLRHGLVGLRNAERQHPLARWRRAELWLLCRLSS